MDVIDFGRHCQVGDRPKWMISESIRRRGIIVGEVSYKGHRVSGGDHRALRMAV